MAETTLKDLREFFGYAKLTDFAKDWKQLSDVDKEQIRKGITDGTFTY
jgi:hypothetical protein